MKPPGVRASYVRVGRVYTRVFPPYARSRWHPDTDALRSCDAQTCHISPVHRLSSKIPVKKRANPTRGLPGKPPPCSAILIAALSGRAQGRYFPGPSGLCSDLDRPVSLTEPDGDRGGFQPMPDNPAAARGKRHHVVYQGRRVGPCPHVEKRLVGNLVYRLRVLRHRASPGLVLLQPAGPWRNNSSPDPRVCDHGSHLR
jgi:hypothetical protein